MSEREQAKLIIDQLPDYKVSSVLAFLRGVSFGDDIEDDRYCEKLAADYFNDTDPHKGETVSVEELATREGVAL